MLGWTAAPFRREGGGVGMPIESNALEGTTRGVGQTTQWVLCGREIGASRGGTQQGGGNAAPTQENRKGHPN